MNIKTLGIGLLVAAAVVWALYMVLTVAAYAHTLPMSEVRRGIQEAVEDRMAPTVVCATACASVATAASVT